MESSAELIKWVLENLNYWVVTIFMTIESSFIPFPSEVIVPPAAWKAMTDDSMNIFLVVIFATIGADLGALINYYLARWLGRPIVYKFANSRFGHMCLIDEAKVRHAEEYFRKAWRRIIILWTSYPRSTAAYQYSGRTRRHEIRAVPALHNARCGNLEHDTGAARLFYIPVHRHQDNQRCLYIGYGIQPRNRLYHSGGCDIRCRFPDL